MDLLYRTLDYLVQGGWVMFPLVVCSLLMWTLIGERLYFFHSLTSRDIPIQGAVRLMAGGEPPPEHAKGLRARIVASFLHEKTGRSDLDRSILRHCAQRQRPPLHRYLAVIAVLAAVAPLLGLLGTVIGMVDTFHVISTFGTGNVKGLSNGISVALITTQSGLIVAIPGLFLSGYLQRRATRQELRLEEITAVLARYV
jgi:biopolymer transport protein ExbB